MALRLILADSHRIFRQGIRALIEKKPGINVTAEAGNGHALLREVREHKPDVVITEILLPTLNGIDATRQICEECNTLKVIALTQLNDKVSVERMLGAGAAGYLTKHCSTEELVSAIRRVHEGHTYLCQRTEDIVAEDLILFLNGKKPSENSSE